VTAVVLVLVVLAPRLLSFHLPTLVVIIPPTTPKEPGCLISTPQAVSHNVNRFGCGGNRNSPTGACSTAPQPAFPLRPFSAVLISDTFHRIAAYSTVSFHGVIPGGDSFSIPQGTLSTNNNTGTGYDWTVDITGGTNMFVVGGDGNGIGTGGSAPFTVAYSANNSCLSSSSPSSTAGNPAGGSYPTSISGSSGNSGSHS
jgi:hypothetical protein